MMSATQKSFPVFDEHLRQGDDLLVCAVLPDAVHRNTNPGVLNTHTNTHTESFISVSYQVMNQQTDAIIMLLNQVAPPEEVGGSC